MHKRCNYPTKINLRFHDASLTYSRLLRMRLVVALRFVRIWKKEHWIYVYVCSILSYTHTERKTHTGTIESIFRNRINNGRKTGISCNACSFLFFSPPYSRYIRISKHYHIIKNRSRGGGGGSSTGKYSTRLEVGQAIKRSSGLRTIQFSGRI